MDGTEFRSREETEKPTEQPAVEAEHEQPPTPAPEIEPAPAQDVAAPVDESTTPSDNSSAPKKKHTLFIVIIAVLVVLGAVFFVWKDQIVGLFVKQQSASQMQNSSSSSAQDEAKITDPFLLKFITPTTGETWLATPKEMTPQGWLSVELLSSYQDLGVGTNYYKSAKAQLAEATPTYKQVGERAGNKIILVSSPTEGMAGVNYLFEQRTDGSVALIAQPQATGSYGNFNIAEWKEYMTNKVTVYDQTTHYDSLSLPSQISLNAKESVTRPEYAYIGGVTGSSQAGVTRTLVKTLGSSKLYKSETKYADTQLTNIGYSIVFPIGTEVTLEYEPNTTTLDKYTFTNGVSMQYKNSEGALVYDNITAIARGCSGSSAAVTRSDSLKDGDLTQIGTTDTGRAVYEITSKSSALYTKAYGEYKDTYTTDAVTFDEYIKQHGLMVIKDNAGELLVYVRGQYGMVGGCAKPVVYLYPTIVTSVNVRVGAHVTVSDPQYPANGWSNVIASPSGQLTYEGKAYSSLFWEGTGYGEYPGINSGTVVKKADVVATMKRQLAEQGLNAKESADFVAFWQDKIPNSPYVRLTWLNTTQMNALAPLYISPKPDTVLRVFLDMEGFDTNIELPAQKLTSTFRHGFTVVEWGGLTSEIRH
jgi:hypothetical protein